MKQIFQKNLVIAFIFFFSSSFAQKGNYEIPPTIPFQPMFTFGAGYHNFQGNIVGTETSSLVGNIGYSTGIRLNIFKDWDASLLFSTVDFYENNIDLNQEFRSNFSAIGLHIDYMWNFLPFLKKTKVVPYATFGIQRINFTTNDLTNNISYAKEKAFSAPVGAGIAFNISERILMQVAYQVVTGFADIDKSGTEEADNFNLVSFNISYDFFTPKARTNDYVIDDSYYKDINFELLDLEDSDGDKVVDLDDYCPRTPKNIKVNEYGCAVDTDHDGIPDYIDKQKKTPKGSIVDEYGVTLKKDRYYSIYSESQAASREYADFYNQFEIERENFTNTNDYLIAKANAFNKTYYNSETKQKINGPQYKVQLGVYRDGIPAAIINKFLSLDDLESIQQEEGNIIYVVGGYDIIDDAVNKQYQLEEKGLDDTKIIIDNNGVISSYIPPVAKIESETEGNVVFSKDSTEDLSLEKLNDERKDSVSIEKIEKSKSISTIVYRVQIGAYKAPLDKSIFKGINNVISYKSQDGWIRYTTGSFTNYADAISYLREMRARGFEDAFISTYKGGERIGLDMAIKQEKILSKQKDNKLDLDIRFLVQIGISPEDFSNARLGFLEKDIFKEKIGPKLYQYFVGNYSTLSAAKKRLQDAQDIGFKDAFILARKDGKRISVEEAQKILNSQ